MAAASTGKPISLAYALLLLANLLVGVGSLSLPYAFAQAGVVLSTAVLLVFCLVSFMTASFVWEALSICNCLIRTTDAASARSLQQGIYHRYFGSSLLPSRKSTPVHSGAQSPAASGNGQLLPDRRSLDDDAEDVFCPGTPSVIASAVMCERSPILAVDTPPFEISERLEYGYMAELLFGQRGKLIIYLVLVVYFVGDLAIYASGATNSLAEELGDRFYGTTWVSSDAAYRILMVVFAVIFVPLSFGDVQDTAKLQLTCNVLRNVSFLLMIAISLAFVAKGEGASLAEVPLVQPAGLVTPLLGSVTYSFMAHHSLSNIFSPVTNKRNALRGMGGILAVVFVIYVLLSVSGVFAFVSQPNAVCEPSPGAPCQVQSLYTLNFASYSNQFVAVFLALFPAFTLSANFPMIATTLRNNIATVLPWNGALRRFSGHRKTVSTLIGCVPSLILAFCTRNVSSLVSITGAFAGSLILAAIPAWLVYGARRVAAHALPPSAGRTPYASPFQHPAWIILALVWAAGCIISNLVADV
jgi:amino acid permease